MQQFEVMGLKVGDDSNAATIKMTNAIVGAVVAALAVGLVYGVVGRFVGEFKYIAIATGAASGLAALKLGGGRSLMSGIVAAAATIVAMLIGKLLITAPEGTTWLAYHMTVFDIAFCYVAAPIAAFMAAASDAGSNVMNRF